MLHSQVIMCTHARKHRHASLLELTCPPNSHTDLSAARQLAEFDCLGFANHHFTIEIGHLSYLTEMVNP